MPCFLLVASDAGGGLSAYDIASHRLAIGAWPIYKGTRNREAIVSGASVLIYLGGAKEFSQTIIASATVKSVDNVRHRVPRIDQENAHTSPPYKILRLEGIRYLSPPLPIRPLIGKL